MVTRRWMTPSSSSRLMRRQHGLDDRPTRSAISATERLASCWIRSRMRASTASSNSDKFSPSFHGMPRENAEACRIWGMRLAGLQPALYVLASCAESAAGKKIAMRHAEVTLDDKFLLERGRVFITGVQALVRVLIDRRRLDSREGLKTAGFLSGYRGSPLGGLDQQAHRAGKLLTAHEIVFKEGLNEDLAATAVWGTQQANLFPGARYDGVFGMWYGKAPGVDRTGDVFKHANFAGTWPKGGVVAVAGDDHACKSSTLPSQSEFAFQDFEMPVLAPADVQEVLDYGLLGYGLSRFSGLWVGLIALADTMDSGATIAVGPGRGAFHLPETFPFPAGGVGIRLKDQPMDKERRLR